MKCFTCFDYAGILAHTQAHSYVGIRPKKHPKQKKMKQYTIALLFLHFAIKVTWSHYIVQVVNQDVAGFAAATCQNAYTFKMMKTNTFWGFRSKNVCIRRKMYTFNNVVMMHNIFYNLILINNKINIFLWVLKLSLPFFFFLFFGGLHRQWPALHAIDVIVFISNGEAGIEGP